MNFSNMSINTTYAWYSTSTVIASTFYSTEYTTQTTESIFSLFSSAALPLFWFFLMYSVLVFIIALLHFLFRTCPGLIIAKHTEKTQSSKETSFLIQHICKESLHHSVFNIIQYLLDIVDLITDIAYSVYFYLFYYEIYSILGIYVFSATFLLILLLSIKCVLFKQYGLIYHEIWNHLIMFDLFTASLCNAIHGASAFYILYRDEINWNIIVQIRVGVVAYSMMVKLFRIACKPSTKQYDPLKSEAINDLENNHSAKELVQDMQSGNKVLSISDESEKHYVHVQEEEEKAVETVEVEEVQLVLIEHVEDEKDQDIQEIEVEAKGMLFDINNCAKFDETRQLLTDLSKNDDLGVLYEEEWNKNVLSLVRDNDKRLRNKSMKVVVKEYVKMLEKKGGDDYKKFMKLLQTTSNGE